MGAGESLPFSEERLEEYMDCTFLSRQQILKVARRFQALNKDKDNTLTAEELLALPELRVNPFATRIVEVFSAAASDRLTFEDFLDMMSVFHGKASLDVKSSYAFRIYDFDDDGYLGRDDLANMVRLVTDPSVFSEAEVKAVVDRIMKDADMDGDEQLSFVEFDSIIKKSPDFLFTFRMRV